IWSLITINKGTRRDIADKTGFDNMCGHGGVSYITLNSHGIIELHLDVSGDNHPRIKGQRTARIVEESQYPSRLLPCCMSCTCRLHNLLLRISDCRDDTCADLVLGGIRWSSYCENFVRCSDAFLHWCSGDVRSYMSQPAKGTS